MKKVFIFTILMIGICYSLVYAIDPDPNLFWTEQQMIPEWKKRHYNNFSIPAPAQPSPPPVRFDRTPYSKRPDIIYKDPYTIDDYYVNEDGHGNYKAPDQEAMDQLHYMNCIQRCHEGPVRDFTSCSRMCDRAYGY